MTTRAEDAGKREGRGGPSRGGRWPNVPNVPFAFVLRAVIVHILACVLVCALV